MDKEHEIITPSDEMAGALFFVDDGCDWAAWIIWNMRKMARIRTGKYEPEPARPQIAPVKLTPKKKPTKKRRHQVEEEI